MSSCSPPLSHHRALTSLMSEQWLIKTAYRPTWFLCWHVRCFDFEHCSSIQTHRGVFSVGSQSRSSEWEAEESGRICWVSAANTLKFMYESHNKRILHGGIEAKGWGGWATPGLQTVANAWLIGWLVGGVGVEIGRSALQLQQLSVDCGWMATCCTWKSAFAHSQSLNPESCGKYNLSHVHTLLMPLWRCSIFSVCRGLGSTQWPCCHLSYTGRTFLHACIHPSTTAPPCRPCLVSLTKIIIFIFIYPKLLFAIFSILIF